MPARTRMVAAVLLISPWLGCGGSRDDSDLWSGPDLGLPVGPQIPSVRTRVTFNLNTHGWACADEMARTVRWVLDVHEAYGVPLDVYLTEPVVQRLAGSRVMERLRTTPLFAVSYFSRVPNPWTDGFDPDWIESACSARGPEQYAAVEEVETHELDLTTGLPDPVEPGGFAYLASLLDTPPLSVGRTENERCAQCSQGGCAGMFSDDTIPPMVARFYRDSGATFVATNAGVMVRLGDLAPSGLYWRPEDAAISLWQSDGDKGANAGGGWLSPEEVLSAGTTRAVEALCPPSSGGPTVACTGDTFLAIKIHDDNFYAQVEVNSFQHVYFDETGARRPSPWNVADACAGVTLRSDEQRAVVRERYEGIVALVAADPDRYDAVNLAMLRSELGL